MLDKIICAHDFNEPARVAARYAAAIARSTHASLDVLHAWHFAAELPNEESSLRQSVIRASRDASHAKLDAVVAELAQQDVKASAALVEGTPEKAITEYAMARGADLVVVGTHALTGIAHTLLGSAAERILRTSSVPVLVVPVTATVPSTFAPKEILVPTDLSPSSGDALRFARKLAAGTGARVVTLHAWEVPPYFFENGKVLDETARLVPEHVKAWMEETFGQDAPKLETIVRRGETSEVIADVCTERQPDLVVMATAGRIGIEHFMLGSITERAVRTLGRPVVTLRRAP